MTSSSSEPLASVLDVALLKSWDFEAWRVAHGGRQLPYRIDLLENHGIRLHWSDRVHEEAWQRSRLASLLRGMESVGVPFVQTALQAKEIRRSAATLAMFESEANFLAMARQAWPPVRRRIMAVITCWLAHIASSSSARRRAVYKYAYRSVDRLYYLSPNQGPLLEEMLGITDGRLQYLPFGVDIETFTPGQHAEDDYVLAVGRDRGRDWPNLFRAAEITGLPLKVCCRPSDVAGERVPPTVEMIGYVDRDKYRRLLAGARVVAVVTRPVVYPSGQSVLLEAMAMGRAVVVTGTPALETYVNDGIDCLVVPPSDPGSLADALRRAVDDPGLRRRLGSEARQAVERSYSADRMWKTVADDLLQMAGYSI